MGVPTGVAVPILVGQTIRLREVEPRPEGGVMVLLPRDLQAASPRRDQGGTPEVVTDRRAFATEIDPAHPSTVPP